MFLFTSIPLVRMETLFILKEKKVNAIDKLHVEPSRSLLLTCYTLFTLFAEEYISKLVNGVSRDVKPAQICFYKFSPSVTIKVRGSKCLICLSLYMQGKSFL